MHFYLFVVIPKLLVIFTGMVLYKYLARPYRLALWMVVLALFAEGTGHFISQVLLKPNLWFFNIYMLVSTGLELLLAAYFLRPVLRRAVPWLFGAYLAFWSWTIIRYSIFNFAVGCLLLTALLCTVLFTIILVDNTMNSEKGVVKDPLFWLCISTVLYYACDIPAISTFTVMATALMHRSRYWETIDVNDILNVISPLLCGVSFLLCKMENKEHHVRGK